jgi:hypothetical protein
LAIHQQRKEDPGRLTKRIFFVPTAAPHPQTAIILSNPAPNAISHSFIHFNSNLICTPDEEVDKKGVIYRVGDELEKSY